MNGVTAFFVHPLKEYVLQYEDHREDHHENADLILPSGEDIDQGIGDGAEGNAFCNAVGKGHGDDGEIAGNGFPGIIEFDARDSGEHEESHDNEGRCRSKGRNGHENGGKEHGQEEEHRHGNGSQPCAAAFRNAGCTFYVGGGGGNAEHRANGGSYGIRHKSALDMGQFVVFIQHIGFGGNADQGADGIENIDEQECQENHYEVESSNLGEIQFHENRSDALWFESSGATGKVGERAESAYGRIRYIETGHFAENTKDPGEEDAPEDITPDFPYHKDGGEEDADDGQHHGDAGGMECAGSHGLLEGEQGNFGGRIGNDDLGTAEADKGDEEADAGGYGLFQVKRNGIEYGLSHIGEGEDNENNPFYEYGGQGHFPGIAHLVSLR